MRLLAEVSLGSELHPSCRAALVITNRCPIKVGYSSGGIPVQQPLACMKAGKNKGSVVRMTK